MLEIPGVGVPRLDLPFPCLSILFSKLLLCAEALCMQCFLPLWAPGPVGVVGPSLPEV